MSFHENYTELKTSRFERKFVFANSNVPTVVSYLKLNPGHFNEIYFKRQVNNIYFDTHNLKNYYDNHMGKSNRSKFRIRWYGDLFTRVEKPILEIKIKNGLVGRKLSFLLKPFDVNEQLNMAQLKEILHTSNVPEWVLDELSMQFPILINSYSRRYFQSFDRNFRFTVDFNLSFHSFNLVPSLKTTPYMEDKTIVLELKYDDIHDSKSSFITNQLPLRLNKFSKYVTGIDIINSHLAV